jgi:aspartate kinase
MPLIVQKFGGSSVADADRIRRCAQRAYDTARAGNQVVVVVSAMGKTTDKLIELANEISPAPTKREVDQLLAAGEQVSIALTAIALETLGQEAISFTGAQAGILTEAAHTRARIKTIDTAMIRRQLDRGRVVVVAGFQGVTIDGQTTTLGRGGSDTTAVALAAALKADVCEIYTDVDGVYTADPRIVPDASKIEKISYEAILELASLGAKVMATRSITFGMRYNVPIHVRHSMVPDTGTMIQAETKDMEQEEVTGVALKTNLGRVTLIDLPGGAGVQGRIFAAIADAGLLVDDIIQTQSGAGFQPAHGGQESPQTATISFTVDHADLVDIRPILDRILADLGQGSVRVDVGLCKVSAVGVGMRTHTGVASRMFKALAETANSAGNPGIAIQNITTSEIKISCILAKEDGELATRAVHEAFGLGSGRALKNAILNR